MDICDVGLLPDMVERFGACGYKTFYPTQQLAFETGFLEGKNVVVAVPTASGKSLIAYVAIARCVQAGKKAILIVPLKALAEEKYAELQQLGFSTALSIGDYDTDEIWLKRYDVIVTTSEKCDSLLRHDRALFDDVSLLVVDEVHLLHSMRRGPTLEVVMTKMRHLQIVALSATVSNARELSEWLGAECVVSEWRPVELKEGVYLDGEIVYANGACREVSCVGDEVTTLVADGLDDGGQVLVFVNSRRSTQSVAKKLGVYLKKQGISTTLASTSNSSTGELLTHCISRGAAFHHAGLARADRTLVEDAFKSGQIRVIVATPTLAAGINLPARRVVVRDWRRFDSNRGYVPISNLEIKQMLGRAGRPKYDKYGEAIIVAKSEDYMKTLFDSYINAPTEKVESKLASDDALRAHVLSLCCEHTDISSLMGFFASTLYSHQYGTDTVEEKVRATIRTLQQSGLVKSGDEISATPLGRRISELYIDPLSGVLFRDCLQDDMAAFGILHAICATPDMPTFYLKKHEDETFDALAHELKDDFLAEVPDSWYEPEEYSFFLAQLKTAAILNDWIHEKGERDICDEFGIGPGDLSRTREQAVWLAYAFKEIAREQNVSYDALNRMLIRLEHGIGEDLLELSTIKGIGRVRARNLFSHGIVKISDVRCAPLEKLEAILGKKTAQNVLKAIGADVAVPDEKGQSDVTNLDAWST